MMEHSPAVVYQTNNTGHVDVANEEKVGSCQEGVFDGRSDEQPSGPPQTEQQTTELREERVKEMDENDVDRILARPPAPRRKLLLDEAPEFVERLGAYKEVKAGEILSFSGTYRAFPTPTVKWYKDEEELQDSERFETSVDQAGSVCLTIHRVEVKDEGVYKCKVENHEGVASTTGYLCVIPGAAATKTKPKGSLSTKRARERSTTPTRNLHPIVEQSSMEAKEEEVCRHLGPSPLRDFIDVVGRRKRFSRQAPGPIAFFHDPGRDQSEEAGIDADVDNVFDADSDSPSSPSDQLTPRLMELTSHTAFPCMTSSVTTTAPPVEHFRSPCVNDDSDYDSDTTPRALIAEPSNLISMSLDPEPTLWEDFLAGGTGFQQCLSHDSVEFTAKHKANESSSHNEKPTNINRLKLQTCDMTSNSRDIKGVSKEPFVHANFANSQERCASSSGKQYTTNIVDVALGKPNSKGPLQDSQSKNQVSDIENMVIKKSNNITMDDVITVSNIATENDVIEPCSIATENHVTSSSRTCVSNEGLEIYPASSQSQFNLATTNPCAEDTIDATHQLYPNISAERSSETDESLLPRRSDDVSDLIVKTSVQNQSSCSFDIFNKYNTSSLTPLHSTKFTIASATWNQLGAKDAQNSSDSSDTADFVNDVYETSQKESPPSMVTQVTENDPLEALNTPVAVKSDEADTMVGFDMNKTIAIDDTLDTEAITSSPISPRDSNTLIHDKMTSNKHTLFRDASNTSTVLDSAHTIDMTIDDLMRNKSYNISSNELENKALMAQDIFETNKAFEEGRVSKESYVNCEPSSETLAIQKKQSDEIFDSNYVSGEQNMDDSGCPSVSASDNSCSNEPVIDRQGDNKQPAQCKEVQICSNANKRYYEDDSLMGRLCDYLDVTTLQFYLLFVTISTAIAALSDVPCPAYLVATTAFVVLLIESCRTIVTE